MALLPLLISLGHAQEARQTVVLHASCGGLSPQSLSATLQQDGQRIVLPLVDNGTDPNDAAGDRVYTGSHIGDPAQYLGVTLSVDVDGRRQDVYQGTLRIGMERTVQLAFEVTTDASGQLVARRRASASPGRTSNATEAVPLMAATFWATLVLVWGAVALRMRERI